MNASPQLSAEVWREAYQAAINDGFPEAIRILLKIREGNTPLDGTEREHIVHFARYLQLKAELHFPYWDDSRAPYSKEHEDSFHAVNMGLYEALISTFANDTETK